MWLKHLLILCFLFQFTCSFSQIDIDGFWKEVIKKELISKESYSPAEAFFKKWEYVEEKRNNQYFYSRTQSFFERESPGFKNYHPTQRRIAHLYWKEGIENPGGKYLYPLPINPDSLSIKKEKKRTTKLFKILKKRNLISNDVCSKIKPFIKSGLIIHPVYLFYCIELLYQEKRINSEQEILNAITAYPELLKQEIDTLALKKRIQVENLSIKDTKAFFRGYKEISNRTVQEIDALPEIIEDILKANFDSLITVKLKTVSEKRGQNLRSIQKIQIQRNEFSNEFYVDHFKSNKEISGDLDINFPKDFHPNQFKFLFNQLGADIGIEGRVYFDDYHSLFEDLDPAFSEIINENSFGILFLNKEDKPNRSHFHIPGFSFPSYVSERDESYFSTEKKLNWFNSLDSLNLLSEYSEEAKDSIKNNISGKLIGNPILFMLDVGVLLPTVDACRKRVVFEKVKSISKNQFSYSDINYKSLEEDETLVSFNIGEERFKYNLKNWKHVKYNEVSLCNRTFRFISDAISKSKLPGKLYYPDGCKLPLSHAGNLIYLTPEVAEKFLQIFGIALHVFPMDYNLGE